MTTVVRLRFGEGPGMLGQMNSSEYKGAYYLCAFMVWPTAVDDDGTFYALDRKGWLTAVRHNGESVRQVAFGALPGAQRIAVGPGPALWIAEAAQASARFGDVWTRLVRADDRGKLMWQLGVPGPGQVAHQALPRPTRYDGGDTFGEIDGVFSDAAGDVFLYYNYDTIRRFDASGRATGVYNVWPDDPLAARKGYLGGGFSATVARDGTVYPYQYETETGSSLKVILNQWPRPGPYLTRVIDMTKSGCGGGDFLLMGSDVRGNLYFQYGFDSENGINGHWSGPTGIARVGPDNVAREILDIPGSYRFDPPSQTPVDYVGDLIGVGPKGELYLEYKSGDYYCVDKIIVAG